MQPVLTWLSWSILVLPGFLITSYLVHDLEAQILLGLRTNSMLG